MIVEDMYGKKVNNGNFLVEGDNWGEVALFYKMIDNKPVLIARWGIGILDKYNVEKIREHAKNVKKAIESGRNIPNWLVEHYENIAKRTENEKTENLMLVEGINVEILNKFLDEGHEAIDYGVEYREEGPVSPPIASFPDKEIVGEY